MQTKQLQPEREVWLFLETPETVAQKAKDFDQPRPVQVKEDTIMIARWIQLTGLTNMQAAGIGVAQMDRIGEFYLKIEEKIFIRIMMKLLIQMKNL